MNQNASHPKKLVRVAVTGFEVFEGVDHNPSEDTANWLADPTHWPVGSKVNARVLATEYDWAGDTIATIIREQAPDIILAFGVSATRYTVCLERFALNIDDTEIVDNAGQLRQGDPIDPEGPDALRTTADLPSLLRMLVAGGIDAEISNHAGSYVCNHVYYSALSCVGQAKDATPCVFVHLPLYSEVWPKQRILEAAKIVLTTLVQDQLTEDASDLPASVSVQA
jgi:pyroglutamyl-peptidase